MQLIDIIPKDIRVVLDFSVQELDSLVTTLSVSEINVTDENRDAVNYVIQELFPQLGKIVEKFQKGEYS